MAAGAPGHYILTAAHCVPGTADDATSEQWKAVNLSLRWHYLLDTSEEVSSYRENCMDAPDPQGSVATGCHTGCQTGRLGFKLRLCVVDAGGGAGSDCPTPALELCPDGLWGTELFAIHHASGQVQQLTVGEIVLFLSLT